MCITDNGCGMTKHELNDWAVMNYSMEERGAAPKEPESVGRGAGTCTGAGRFLTGNLSFFGVGSKNAAFFIGSCVKVVTRKAEERYVHELCLAAEDLEQRYRNGESVYEGDMVHRNPGDESTLSRVEQTFDAARAWVREESSAQGGAFTRVIIGDLKPEILQQLTADFDGGQLCRELAHLYHYYLHGEKGNRGAAAATEPAPAGPGTASPPAGMLPNGEPVPLITLRHAADTRLLWERRLTDVEDDFETQMLRGQKAELQFTLNVPDRGTVIGVLYYFPYENDRETVPREEGIAPPASVFGAPGAGLTQAGGPGATQFGATRATQGGHHSGSSQEGVSDDEDGAPGAWRAPIFEAFWQGRLIPGARIESLPFIEAVRQKRNAAGKDAMPDEVFNRLRGALFFGPAFRVTRNK